MQITQSTWTPNNDDTKLATEYPMHKFIEFYFRRLLILMVMLFLTGTVSAIVLIIVEFLPSIVILLLVIGVLVFIALTLLVSVLLVRSVIIAQLEPVMVGEIQ